MGTLYDRVRASVREEPITEPSPTPSRERRTQGVGLYERVAQRFRPREERPQQLLEFRIPQQQRPQTVAATTPAIRGEEAVTPQGVLSNAGKEAGRGIARAWAASGARVARELGTAETDVVDPQRFFGTSLFGEALGEVVFGQKEPFNVASEDREFLEAFGADPEVARGTGGALTLMLTALDLTGAGGAAKGLKGAIASVKNVKNVDDAFKLGKSLGLSDDIAQQYADVFVRTKSSKEAKEALEAASKLQSTTKPQISRTSRVLREASEDVPARPRVDQPTPRPDEITPTPPSPTVRRPEIPPETPTPTPREGREVAQEILRKRPRLGDEARRYDTPEDFAEQPVFYTVRKAGDVTEPPHTRVTEDFELALSKTTDGNTPDEVVAVLAKKRTRPNATIPREAGEEVFRSQDLVELGVGDQANTDLFAVFNQANRRKETLIAREARGETVKQELSARRSRFRAVKDRYGLTDADTRPLFRGRNLANMTQDEFDEFIVAADEFGESEERRRVALAQLEAVLEEKELIKHENLVAAMNLPPIHKLDEDQLINLENIFNRYEKGDEFLTVRQLETIDKTKLKGLKTVREVIEFLAKETGEKFDDIKTLALPESLYFKGDVSLSRVHPFLKRLVEIKNTAFFEADMRIITLSNEIDELVKSARGSRKRGVLEKLIPTDRLIVDWLEAAPDVRKTLAVNMTDQELKAAGRMDEVFREYYEYLVSKKVGQKFSRFEDQYFPHVRRGILEAWKDDGFIEGFKAAKNRFVQDQKYMDILNERTGDILPYEKWIGFTQFRNDNLIPTANAAKAFDAYVRALERGRYLDEMVPEIMTYVHALSPRKMSERGIELDTSLQRFVKEWINANKGRIPKGFFNPGGTFDWSLRSGVALTRVVDLGLNFTTQLAAPVGETTMTLTMLKPKAFTKAVGRMATPQGRKIIKDHEAFVGRSLFDEMTRAANSVGDNMLSGMFGIFHGATRKNNELFLLGKLTDEEFKTGKITAERLGKLQVEMGKYRSVRGLESIRGRTAEAEAMKQYKSWAIPILRATATNAADLSRIVRKDGIRAALSSNEGKELFYSFGLAAGIGGAFWGRYTQLRDEKERTAFEDLQFKAMRDALSIVGALDPTLWTSVRFADFLQDFSEAIVDMVTLDRYKTTGELKAPKEFARLLTPAPIRQLQRELAPEEGPTERARQRARTGGVVTPPGLPPLSGGRGPGGLPELPEARKLPPIPGLPPIP